ncbi:glutamate synthase-related protein [Serratia ureilytica]
MIEIKLSQGAKPGHGGILPAKKVDAEIAATRGACRKASIASRRPRTAPSPHSAGNDAFHTAAARAVRRQTGRFQAVHRPPVGSSSPSSRRCCTRILPDFTSWWTARKAAPAPRRATFNYMGMPLRGGCCSCITRW